MQSKLMPTQDINNDAKTTILALAMVLIAWLAKKQIIDQSDMMLAESILGITFGFFTNRRNAKTRKTDDTRS